MGTTKELITNKLKNFFEKLTKKEPNEETFDIFNLYWYSDGKELKMAFEEKDENEKYIMKDCLTKEPTNKNGFLTKFCSFNARTNKVEINYIPLKTDSIGLKIFPKKIYTKYDPDGVTTIDIICPKTFLPYNPETIVYRDFNVNSKSFSVGYNGKKDIKICTPKSKLESIVNATNREKEKIVKKETKEYLEKKCKADTRADLIQNELK